MILFYRFITKTFALLLMFAITGQIAVAKEFGPLDGWTFSKGNGPTIAIVHEGHGPKPYVAYAQKLAQMFPQASVVLILRPGHRYAGKKSPGGPRCCDHLTKRNNDLVTEALKAAKAQNGNHKLIAVGHYDGSLQIGVIAATSPGLIDHAILASCPCDLPRWRTQRKGKNTWVHSQSPHEYLAQLPNSTPVHLIHGKRDGFIPVTIARRYLKLAQKAGKTNVTLTEIPGAGFKLAQLEPTLTATLAQLVR